MEQFKKFGATHLFCQKCNAATPVRERLLLVLPDGELYEYICSRCGSSLGKRKVSGQQQGYAPPAPRGGRPEFM
jgi:hypothetical protein